MNYLFGFSQIIFRLLRARLVLVPDSHYVLAESSYDPEDCYKVSNH